MLVIGLTGGIATGKSTVSGLLSSPAYSIPVVDADKIAREVVLPGTRAYAKIVAHFAPNVPDLVLADGGGLNRPALGRYVFANESERRVLNGITHPAVRAAMLRRVVYHWLTGAAVVVLDVPLLFESGLDVYCGYTLTVACARDVQRARLLARDAHLSETEADQRIASQMAIERKAELADLVVWNNGTVEQLEDAVGQIVRAVRPSLLCTVLEWFPPFGAFMAFITVMRRYYRRSRVKIE